MLKNIEELKQLIIFCKQEKLSELTIGDVSFKISDIAHIEKIQSVEEINKELSNLSSKTLVDDLDEITKAEIDKEDEEDLFWSSNT